MGAFESGNSIMDMAKDVTLGGVSAAAGLYLYNRVIGQPLVNMLRSTGKYAGVLAAALAALAFDYIGNRVSNPTFSAGINVAGYAILGMALKGLIPGDPPVMVPQTSAAPTAQRVPASAFQGLSPVPLAHEVI